MNKAVNAMERHPIKTVLYLLKRDSKYIMMSHSTKRVNSAVKNQNPKNELGTCGVLKNKGTSAVHATQGRISDKNLLHILFAVSRRFTLLIGRTPTAHPLMKKNSGMWKLKIMLKMES
jgi:hypothetical protein